MDRIEKALQQLSIKERKQVKNILMRLASSNYRGLTIVKLKGRDDIFRIRKGNIRIIYRTAHDRIFILAIERRNEKTYRNI